MIIIQNNVLLNFGNFFHLKLKSICKFLLCLASVRMPLTMPEHSWISPPSYGEALNDQPPAYEEIRGVKL